MSETIASSDSVCAEVGIAIKRANKLIINMFLCCI